MYAFDYKHIFNINSGEIEFALPGRARFGIFGGLLPTG
jgi:hypothetical protein